MCSEISKQVEFEEGDEMFDQKNVKKRLSPVEMSRKPLEICGKSSKQFLRISSRIFSVSEL